MYFLHVFNILQSSNDGNNSELDLEEEEEEEENSSNPDEVIKHYIKNERNQTQPHLTVLFRWNWICQLPRKVMKKGALSAMTVGGYE